MEGIIDWSCELISPWDCVHTERYAHEHKTAAETTMRCEVRLRML